MKLTNMLRRFGNLPVIATILAGGFLATAQETQVSERKVPAAVIAAFKAAYPKATIRGYARERENGRLFYEVESIEGQTTRDVLYYPDGTVAVIEESISLSDLPTDAHESIRRSYPKAVVRKAEKIIRDGLIEYEVHAKLGKKQIELKFDAKGKLEP